MSIFMKVILAICAAFSLFIIFGLGVAGIVKSIEAPDSLETSISLNGLADYYVVDVDNFKMDGDYVRYYLKDGQDYPVVLISSRGEIDPSSFYVTYNHRSIGLENNILVVGWKKSAWSLATSVLYVFIGVGTGVFAIMWLISFPKKKIK